MEVCLPYQEGALKVSFSSSVRRWRGRCKCGRGHHLPCVAGLMLALTPQARLETWLTKGTRALSLIVKSRFPVVIFPWRR
jgi:hypothetical protein